MIFVKSWVWAVLGTFRRALAHAMAVTLEHHVPVVLGQLDVELPLWGAINFDPPHLVQCSRSNLLSNVVERFTGKKIHGPVVRVVVCTLNVELRDAA